MSITVYDLYRIVGAFMEAKDYFFRLSYQQYQKGKIEERARWEPEVMRSIIELLEQEGIAVGDRVASFVNSMCEVELKYSNSFHFEKLIKNIIKKEPKMYIAEIIQTCWIASWDLPESKNAQVQTEAFYDGSHLIRINTELVINISRIVCLYVIILLLEDILPEADFRDMVSLNTLKNKFIKDLKNDTDEGTEYLQECFLSNSVKKALNMFTRVYYEAAVVFIMMHEIGHILELDERACRELNIISSKQHEEENLIEKQIKAEENADQIGYKYSDEYIEDSAIFNMGPVLAILALSVNRDNIQVQTDHPSIKQRYEKAVADAFEGKNSMDIIHTRKLLYKINKELQDEKCWSVEDKNWWII